MDNQRVMGEAVFDNSWSGHLRSSFLLGAPFVGAQLAQMAINTTDVIMVGWLGTTELAAVVLGAQMFFIVFIFGSGFSSAIMPMVAQALGRGDSTAVRRSTRMGMWVVILYGVVTAPLLWYSKPILEALGQEPDVATLAQGYLRVIQLGIFPNLILMSMRSFLSGLERASVILTITIFMFVTNAAMNYLFIFGHYGAPAWGLQGSAFASVCAAMVGCLLAIGYIQWQPQTRAYELFVRFWRPDWVAFREILGLGLPISLTILAETSLFAAASLLMGTLGTVELAAHGIALQCASIAFMIPLGLAQVATVRVGFAHGSGDRIGVQRAAVAVLIIGVAFTGVGGLMFALIPKTLGALFLDVSRPDAIAVLNFAAPLIVIAGLFQLVDGLQAIGAGLLRGMKDTRIPMILAIIAYWPIGFACAWIFGLKLGFGGQGVWFGFVTGLAAAAVFLCGRFYVIARR